MVHQLRHRCPKGAATVEMILRSPRHILTLLGLDRLEIGHDVAPGEKYTFSFRMSTPSLEQSRYVSWQLRRNIDGAAKATDWIGEASPEQKVWFVKPACDNVRERATALSNEIRDLYRSGNEMQDEAMQKLGPAVSALQNEANENNCSLDSGLINPPMSDESDD